jgi:hypothetical protein
MVNDEKTPKMRIMKMGNLSLKPCPHEYRCEACDIERQFIEEMKEAIVQFRNKVRNITEI